MVTQSCHKYNGMLLGMAIAFNYCKSGYGIKEIRMWEK